ncbi:small Rab GTP binding protein [Trypanosoma theileri]|uniref:Small Rab GTP binding protein n=1 Tax=Trypanosoma theileri TaxID=67003 RepID=A0A1X0NN96_9TRYP|nr:small Rab GTP binding protein [Trypanosoma theileri]ORC86195.1 small Rab GTP binding protein [Trypanosoma theileri]
MASAPASTKKYKLVLLGDSGVGKSSLVQRLAKDEWNENQNSTVGASFFRYACPVDDTAVHFDIWDTAGQERYKSLASMYYRGAAAALVVYEIPSYESFERAKYWVQELAANSPETIVTLVGNKSDLAATHREVSSDEAAEYAAAHNLMFAEASAKDGTGVQAAFVAVGRRLRATNSQNAVREGGVVGRQPNTQPRESSGGCCK